MKKKIAIRIALALTFVFGCLIGTARSQEDITQVQDPAFSRTLRPAVPFEHDAHNEKAGIEACNVCHHVVEDGKVVEDESSEGTACSECHAGGETGGLQLPVVRAYHLRCRGCHMENQAGPILCSECHPRSSSGE